MTFDPLSDARKEQIAWIQGLKEEGYKAVHPGGAQTVYAPVASAFLTFSKLHPFRETDGFVDESLKPGDRIAVGFSRDFWGGTVVDVEEDYDFIHVLVDNDAVFRPPVWIWVLLALSLVGLVIWWFFRP